MLIVGYQPRSAPAAARWSSGARELKIHGRYVRVRAEVVVLDAFSVHADADELVDWATAGPPPQTTYLVHGEPAAADALADRLCAKHDWNAVVPRDGEHVLV